MKVNDKRRFREDGTPVEPGELNPSEPPVTQDGVPSARVDREPPTRDAPKAAQPSPPATPLMEELEAARKRIDELARGLQRSEADREAFKQRMNRERDQLLDLEKGKVAVVLLESIDDLELCLVSPDGSALFKGVQLIRDGLIKKAEEFGLERVELLGTLYDPNVAEASDMEVTANEADDGRVLGVLKAAWRLKGRVLRPGRVKVAKYVRPAQA